MIVVLSLYGLKVSVLNVKVYFYLLVYAIL